jgi:hypothetical protein
MRYGFDVSRSCNCQLASPKPILDRVLKVSRLCVVMSHELGLRLRYRLRLLSESLSNIAVQLLSPPPEKCFVGRVLHEGVLEDEGCLWKAAAAKNKARCDKLVERIGQLPVVAVGDRGQQIIGELPADSSTDLRLRSAIHQKRTPLRSIMVLAELALAEFIGSLRCCDQPSNQQTRAYRT